MDFLKLSKAEYKQFCDIISNMIDNNKLSLGGKFRYYEDAVTIYSYFKNCKSIKLLSICTSEKYAKELKEDGYFKNIGISAFNDSGKFSNRTVENDILYF